MPKYKSCEESSRIKVKLYHDWSSRFLNVRPQNRSFTFGTFVFVDLVPVILEFLSKEEFQTAYAGCYFCNSLYRAVLNSLIRTGKLSLLLLNRSCLKCFKPILVVQQSLQAYERNTTIRNLSNISHNKSASGKLYAHCHLTFDYVAIV